MRCLQFLETLSLQMKAVRQQSSKNCIPKIIKTTGILELLNTNVAANAHLDLTTLQMMDQSSVNFSTRRSDIAQDAKINWYLGLFGTMLSRYRIDYYLNGAGAQANDSEVIFGNNDQSFDIQANVTHEALN